MRFAPGGPRCSLGRVVECPESPGPIARGFIDSVGERYFEAVAAAARGIARLVPVPWVESRLPEAAPWASTGVQIAFR